MYDYFQPIMRLQRQKGRFGVEIETEVLGQGIEEGLKSYGGALTIDQNTGGYQTIPKSDFWTAKHDNSLRNFGVEYVLKKPHDIQRIKMALQEFSALFANVNFIKNAPATSVHVHVNMQDFNARQLGNFIILWTLFENILVEYSGEPRRSNLFTLPMRCAEGNVRRVVQLFRDLVTKNKSALMFEEQMSKYAAMNLASMKRFCTIEIRCFRGETDKDEIFKWVKILDKLYEFASSSITPPDIVARYGTNGFDLFYEVFRDSAEDILKKVENPLGMIERNVFYAAVMADAVSDWEKIDPVFVHKEGDKKDKPLKKLTTEEAIHNAALQMDQFINPHITMATNPPPPNWDGPPQWAHILDDGED